MPEKNNNIKVWQYNQVFLGTVITLHIFHSNSVSGYNNILIYFNMHKTVYHKYFVCALKLPTGFHMDSFNNLTLK